MIEIVNHQILDGHPGGGEGEPIKVLWARGAGQDDEWCAAVTRLARAVDHHRLRDRRQGGRWRDRLYPAADAEVNRAVGGNTVVDLRDGPAEAAGPTVARVGDGERREHLPALERLDGEVPAAFLEATGGTGITAAAEPVGRHGKGSSLLCAGQEGSGGTEADLVPRSRAES